MKSIDLNELANVSGGADLFHNMGKGADTVSDRWARGTYEAMGGANSPVAGFGAGVSGLFGRLAGAVAGLGHTVYSGFPMPDARLR